MNRIERIAIWLAWHLPRRVAYWAYVRVATYGVDGNPTEQSITEPMDRWMRP